jgi:hypothetical protein
MCSRGSAFLALSRICLGVGPLAAKCARANFASKWSRPSQRPPQRRPTLLFRACIHYALGGEAAPRRCRRNKEEREKMKGESTHTHYTNEILLGASVSDHPQNFATKEASLSPTHWQTPAFFFCALRASDRGRSALPTCTASPKHPNLPACLLLPIAFDYYGLGCFDPLAAKSLRHPARSSLPLPLSPTRTKRLHGTKQNLRGRAPRKESQSC